MQKKIEFIPKTVQVDTLYLHTEHFGDQNNPACLLIAGAMATARFWSNAFCEQLVHCGFFVIRYDHRDMGESSSIDWQKNPYMLTDLARDAIHILDGYGINQAHLVGHSMGGYIAQLIGLQFPKRALSICSIAAGPVGATKESELPLTADEQAISNKTWEIILSRKDGPTKESTIQSFLPVWQYFNGEFSLDEEMAEAYTRDLILRSNNAIRAGNNHELLMGSLDLEKSPHDLQKITAPALIIHGDADHLVFPRHGESVANSIKSSHLVIIPGMGHVFFHRGLEEQITSLISSQMQKALT